MPALPGRKLPDKLRGVKRSPFEDPLPLDRLPDRSRLPVPAPNPVRCPGRWGRAALACLAAGVVAAAPPTPEPESLAGALERALRAPALQGARVAVLVARRDDGRVLFEHEPDRALVPASNLKLLTAIACLASFGPTHRFTTRLLSDAEPDAEGAVGWLAVHGSGDPSLTSEDWWRLAADLRLRGLRRVRGDLWLDDSLFDRERWHPDWGTPSARAYHAPVGALQANYGAFAVEVAAGSPDGPARVVVDPPIPYLRLVNRARTGGPTRLSVDREAGAEGEVVVVSGRIADDAVPQIFYRSVLDPTRYAGGVLRMQLAALGISVDGSLRVGPAPAAGRELLAFEGRPVGEIVRLLLKYSSNVISESMVKAMGGARSGDRGSWHSGLPALRAGLGSAGIPTDGLALVDGSGLAYGNRVSPRALVAALRVGASSFSFGPEFVSALPIAAGDGTLRERAEGARGAVRAKTGLLTRVTGLSGYAATREGPVAFSILVNGYRVSAEEAMSAVDAFVEALVR